MELAEARACDLPEPVTLGRIVKPVLNHRGDTADDLELRLAFEQNTLQQDGVLDPWHALPVMTQCEATAIPSDLESRHDRLSLSMMPQPVGANYKVCG